MRARAPRWIGFAALAVTLHVGGARAEPPRLEYGVDRSNLTWSPADVQRRTLERIAALHVGWFRDELSGVTPPTNAAFVTELRYAKENGLKFLAIVNPRQVDFAPGYSAPNAGWTFYRRCGWDSGSLEVSSVEIPRFVARLKALFDEVKAAHLTIDAFEIGNEFDWICFDGDVPDGREPTAADFDRFLRGYARYLDAAARVIHDPAYFPKAPIVTFGIAHVPDTEFGHHIPRPERILEALRDLDGVDHLRADGIAGVGDHVYPSISGMSAQLETRLATDSKAAGGLPVWITEWGFPRSDFKSRRDITRADAIRAFYDGLHHSPTPLGPNFFYAYSEIGVFDQSLVGSDGREGPEAEAIAREAGR